MPPAELTNSSRRAILTARWVVPPPGSGSGATARKARWRGGELNMHDIDAWRAALGMIQHYGPHALKRALAHTDKLRKAEDLIGVVAWTLIADAIAELSRDRRNDEPLN
jgi:hypothetical protein